MKKYLFLGILFTITVLSSIFYLHRFQKLTMSKSVCDEVLGKTALEPIKIFDGKPAKVDFSKHPNLNLYRTTISEQVAKGPNFAGHYTFISWGCGTDCITYTIIDSITGISLFDSGQVAQNMNASIGLDSRLLTFNSKDGLQDFKGMSLNEIESKNIFLSKRGREYYELIEESSGQAWLNKLCTENVLDGIYAY